MVRYNPNHFFRADMPARVMRQGEYFVMGDNRDYSYDSRFWGIVSEEQLMAKPWFIWFSYLHKQNPDQYILRTPRIFKRVD